MKTKIFLICFFCWGCNIKFDGRPGVSVSIQDSLERQVFWSEYNIELLAVETHPIYFNYSSSWSEKHWRYTKYFHSDTFIEEGYQLCVKVDARTLEELNYHWSFGRKRSEAIGQIGKDRIWISEFEITEGDTICFDIYKGGFRIIPSERLFIGKLIFIKKD